MSEKDSFTTVTELRRHVRQVAKVNGIDIKLSYFSTGTYGMVVNDHTVMFRWIHSPARYATAMHEFGHLLNNDDEDDRLTKEVKAWEWALNNMLPGIAERPVIKNQRDKSLLAHGVTIS
jgi:hypothetical protein